MKDLYPTVSPYIVLRRNIAIPHAGPEDGVKKLGMSLLKIKDGLTLEDGNTFYIVVVISAVDKNQHLNALLQLMKLADDDKTIKSMRKKESKDEIYQMIKIFSK